MTAFPASRGFEPGVSKERGSEREGETLTPSVTLTGSHHLFPGLYTHSHTRTVQDLPAAETSSSKGKQPEHRAAL